LEDEAMTTVSSLETNLGPWLAGMSLMQYAAVVAALSEGFALEEVLAVEGVRGADWPRAAAAWRERLAEDAAKKGGGELFEKYSKELASAEDRLGRSVTPLGEDLDAWLAFLRAWSSAPTPAAILGELALTMNDVSRLQRSWAVRMAEDEPTRRRALALSKQEAKGLPSVQVEPAVLRASPAARPRPGIGTPKPNEAAVGGRLPEDVSVFDRASHAVPSAQMPTYLRHQGVAMPDLAGLGSSSGDAFGAPRGSGEAPAAVEDSGDMTWEVPPGATGKPALPFSTGPSISPSPFAVVSRRPGAQPRRDPAKLPPTTVLPAFIEPGKGSTGTDIDATAEMRRIPPAEEEVLPFSAPSPPPDERRLARFDTQTGLPLPVPVWIEVPPTGKRRPQ
jgi:hypothetical protein